MRAAQRSKGIRCIHRHSSALTAALAALASAARAASSALVTLESAPDWAALRDSSEAACPEGRAKRGGEKAREKSRRAEGREEGAVEKCVCVCV